MTFFGRLLENELRLLAFVGFYLNQTRVYTEEYLSSNCQYDI